MKTVEANGREFEFDDNASPEQMGAAIDEYFTNQEPKRLTGEQLASALQKENEGNVIAMGKGFDKTFSGLGQTGLEMLEKVGLVDEGTASEFTKRKDSEYSAFDKNFEKDYGDSFGNWLGNMVGEVSPYLVIPGGQKTAAKRLAALTAAGGAIGGAQYQEEGSDASRLGSAALGASTALAFGSVFELMPLAKNSIRKYLSKGLDSDFAKQAESLTKKTGVEFKLPQVTGEARSEAATTLARADSKGEMIARGVESRQSEQLKTYFTKVMNRLKPDSKRFGDSVKNSFEKLMGSTNSKTGLLGTRAKQADLDFSSAYAASKGTKDIPINSYSIAIDDLISGVKDSAARNPRSASAKVYKNLLSLKKGAQKGNMDAREIHNELRSLGKAMKGKQRLFSDSMDVTQDSSIAKKLYAAIKSDADKAPQLKSAMSNYAKASDEIESIRESVIGKLFNRKGVFDIPEGVSLTPEMIEKSFLSMDSTQIRHAMRALSKVDPVVKKRLQAHFIKSRLDGAGKWGQADIPNFSPESMLDLINTKKQSFFSVFDDPATAKDVMDGLKTAQRIMMFNNRTAGQTSSIPVKLAGVLASRDSTFISRLGAELATPSFMQKLVLDPGAMQALKVISKPGASQKSAIAAAATLTDLMNESE